MNDYQNQNTGYQQPASIPSEQPRKRALDEEAVALIREASSSAQSDLAVLGIEHQKLIDAVERLAKKRAQKIIAQAVAEVRRRAKAEVVSASQLLEEIALGSGIKLTLRTPPGRKRKAKPEASGDATGS